MNINNFAFYSIDAVKALLKYLDSERYLKAEDVVFVNRDDENILIYEVEDSWNLFKMVLTYPTSDEAKEAKTEGFEFNYEASHFI